MELLAKGSTSNGLALTDNRSMSLKQKDAIAPHLDGFTLRDSRSNDFWR